MWSPVSTSLLLLVFPLYLALGLASCASSDEASCTAKGGVVCDDCALADCEITCGDDEFEYCVSLSYFGGASENTDDLRCAFCDNE